MSTSTHQTSWSLLYERKLYPSIEWVGIGLVLALVHLVIFYTTGSTVVTDNMMSMVHFWVPQLLAGVLLVLKCINMQRRRRSLPPLRPEDQLIWETRAAKAALYIAFPLFGVALIAIWSSVLAGFVFFVAAAYLWGLAEISVNPLDSRQISRLWPLAFALVIGTPWSL